jgi:microcompartment protein CcmK/EutM
MKKRTPVAFVGIVGMALIFAACGSSNRSGASSSSSSDNTFVLSEFTIIPPANTLHAGNVSIAADNVGGEVHELVIVRAASAAGLPMKSDGSVDEAKIPASDKIGEFQKVAARSQQTDTFDLTSGTYVAFCNIIDSMMGSDTTMMGSDTTMMGSDTTMMGSDTTMMSGTSSTMSGMDSGTGHVHFAKGMHVTFTVS